MTYLVAAVAITAAWLIAVSGRAEAQTIEFLLGASSHVTAKDRSSRAEELHGKFDLTVMPIPDAHTVEAVTGILWHSKSFRISGTGFLERLGRNKISMVLDANVNGQPVLLTSTSHPTERNGRLRLSLTTAPESPIALSIELHAFANTTDAPDADGDGIPDFLDLCPNKAERIQKDSDLDGVGDACDECPDTLLGSPALANGCSLVQACPCNGPAPDRPWANQRAYLKCVGRALKKLVNAEEMTRAQARSIVQAAVRSKCGTPLIAMLAAPMRPPMR